MTDEITKRIDFLKSGPWIELGTLAWEIVSHDALEKESSISIRRKQRELSHLLRPHWDDEIMFSEGEVRNSFDEALTVYQLYELAIENGYIPEEAIRDEAKDELERLLWSDGARSYLFDYSYVAVAYLAQRVGANLGFRNVDLPPIQAGSESRFATFLSQHILWYGDDVLDGWIGFLDDYQVIRNKKKDDKDLFWDFLTNKKKAFTSKEEKALWTLVEGADRFVTRLSELATALPEEEKPSYGMFYAYWMAKLYGYDLTKRGFVQDPEQTDWAALLSSCKRLEAPKTAEKDPAVGIDLAAALEAFRHRDEQVRQFWNVTRKQLASDPIRFRKRRS